MIWRIELAKLFDSEHFVSGNGQPFSVTVPNRHKVDVTKQSTANHRDKSLSPKNSNTKLYPENQYLHT